ncbi:alkylation response protein AidB-like acyl-CoA dehydrogenase [Jatrophihabitans sp. GAS493]|uniref:acyl-CoA dehydrogenase family protein n=1 Tax=Jatrophihabitans sp. GAS493 TaxID=1907575 RepID=UPI000BB7BCBF|nr:acyl-CoA dehydrogenase family protein [Jatrophihabitans sp. GAS493]SOD74662.1 alkylation response protein AidB-like acyl-CoA dehydrogenase [Jatrophihabitans sp. GAS493]
MSTGQLVAPRLGRSDRAELAEGVAAACAKWFPLPVTKERTSDSPLDRAAWAGLCRELSPLGLRLPVERGGAALPLAYLAVVSEAAGAALVPAPLTTGAAITAPLLAAVDAEILPSFLDGSAIVSTHDGRSLTSCEAVDGWRVSGSVSLVEWACDADGLLVTLDSAEEDWLELGWTPLPVGGAQLERLGRVDATRSAARVTLTEVPVTRLGRVSKRFVAQLRTEAMLLCAAEAIGASTAMLTQTIEYAKLRTQFGHPIGSFQAVQHRLADLHGELESARAALWAAVDSDADADATDIEPAALVASIRASQAAELVGREGLHLHGGIGFTWEHDAHLYFKRALSGAQDFGGIPARLRALADLLAASSI